jgi:cytochrome c553
MRLLVALWAGIIGLALPLIALANDDAAAAGEAKARAAGCLACHGTNGVATAENIPDLAAEPDLFVQFQLVFFRDGTRKNDIMNQMAKPLSDEDIRNLGAFFAALPVPARPRLKDPAPAQTALGERLAAALRCANCHGDHFQGVDNIARLAGQQEAYVLKSLRDFKAGARTGTGLNAMADLAYPLGETEMKALAHYASQLR